MEGVALSESPLMSAVLTGLRGFDRDASRTREAEKSQPFCVR
jgi:hypothetical protein